MKLFKEPTLNVLMMAVEDIITTSGGNKDESPAGPEESM